MTVPRPTRARGSVALAVVAVLVALVALALNSAGDRAPSDEERATRIAAGLRCPVCTDLSAADSSAPLARQMRVEIAQQVEAGLSDEEIRRGFVDAYGPSVLLSPPAEGIGRVAHLIPLLVLGAAVLAGAGVVVRGRRSPGKGDPGRPDPGPSPADRVLVDRALAELLKEES